MHLNQYWQHKTSGDVYAVQVDGKRVISACGPLHHSEVTTANLNPWNFDSESELVADVQESREEYRALEAHEIA